MNSLKCPSLSEQRTLWNQKLANLTFDNVSELLRDTKCRLLSFRCADELNGLINRIFVLTVTMETNEETAELILKLNNPQRRYRGHRTSEGALIAYLKRHTSIPVPDVLAYDDTEHNVLKCSYLLMAKASGSLLKHALPSKVPDSLLDQMIGIIEQLRALKPFGPDFGALAFFGPDGQALPIVQECDELCSSFFDNWNKSIKLSVREMNKMACFGELTRELDEKRSSLERIVDSTPRLNRLNGHDPFHLAHYDLNETNIIVDPHTLRINCIIDWEWANYGLCDDFGFPARWFMDRADEQQALRKRVSQKCRQHFKLKAKSQKLNTFRAYLTTVRTLATRCHDNYYIRFELNDETTQSESDLDE